MNKIKSIPSSVFSIIRNFVFKLYPNGVQNYVVTFSLLEVTGAQKETSSTPLKSLLNKAASRAEIRSRDSSKKVNVSEISGGKRGAGCKKRKICDKPKPPKQPPSKSGLPGYNFKMEKCKMFETHKPNVKKWRSLSYALVPLALGLSALILATRGDHLEHDYMPYEYMNRRTKRFPWRDGRTSLFYGPNNLIPDVVEDRIAKENEANPQHIEEVI